VPNRLVTMLQSACQGTALHRPGDGFASTAWKDSRLQFNACRAPDSR